MQEELSQVLLRASSARHGRLVQCLRRELADRSAEVQLGASVQLHGARAAEQNAVLGSAAIRYWPLEVKDRLCR